MWAARPVFRGSLLAVVTALCWLRAASADAPKLSSERAVFQTVFGDFELAFFPEVAPVTVSHIVKLIRMGCYNSNHFFRVDAHFVAQTADVASGRLAPLDARQRQEAIRNVPLEVRAGVKHVAGMLSMARSTAPDSGTNSFFVCLGAAPHLDMQYSVFGMVVRGMEAFRKMELLETTRSGMFVMPKQRVTFHSTWVYYVMSPHATLEAAAAWSLNECESDSAGGEAHLQLRIDSLAAELLAVRKKCITV